MSVVSGQAPAGDEGDDDSGAETIDTSDHAPDAGIPSKPANATILQSENSQNTTNEPEKSEPANIAKTQKTADSLAISTANAALDKPSPMPVVSGPSSAGDEDPDKNGAENVEASNHAPESDIVSKPADAINRHTENSQNTTNEPEISEPANIAKTQKTADFPPNHIPIAALDKPGQSSAVSGPSPVDTRQHGSPTQRPPDETGRDLKHEGWPVNAKAAGSKKKPQVSNSKAKAYPWGDRPVGGGRSARDRNKEREIEREWKLKRKELRRTLEEEIKPGTVLTPAVNLDLVATTAKTKGIVLPNFPARS